MALSRRMAAAPIVLLVLLVVATELGTTTVVEARDCKSSSHKFKGACFSSSNCDIVCGTESFTSGECSKTFKCVCKKPC